MTAADPIRVVLADDDPRIRVDLAALLDLEDDLAVVAVAADGREAVDYCRRHQPNVAVLDVRMPVLSGIEATRRIRQHPAAATRVLVITTFDLDSYVFGAIRAGAAGFLLKDRTVDELATAVRTIAAGDGVVAPRATARLLEAFAAPRPSSPAAPLTERETELVTLLATGMSNSDVAVALRVSPATVKTHVSNVLTKLGLGSRLQVVVWAYENGLAGLPRADWSAADGGRAR